MKRTTCAWFIMLPSFIYLFAVIIIPWLYSIYLSFTDLSYTTPGSGKFVWDAEYVKVFADPKLYSSLFKSLILMIPALLLQMILGLLIAWGFYSLGTGKGVRILTSVFTLPMLVSSSVVALSWYFIFHGQWGIVTYILRTLKLIPVGYTIWSDRNVVLLGYLMVDTWQWLPFSVLIFWAGMNAIPLEVVESARVNGAKGFFFFRKILLPGVLPLLAIVLLLRGMDLFKIFDPIYIITYGGPGDASETIHFLAYRESFRLWNLGYGSTISMIIFFIIEVASALYVKFFIAGYVYKR